MYLKMFGFHEKPFHITPNPRFIFLSKNHKEAFAHLLYGIQQRVGFLALSGEIGTGKTTVLRTLLSQLSESDYRVALVFNPCLSALELLQTIHKEFAIPFESGQSNLAQLLESLNQFLLDQRSIGKTVVLVVDEAQNLDPSVLEQLRLLSNLETETEKLIQMILVGQPELDQVLQRKDLRQLRQRLAVRYKLREMDEGDTAKYVLHRAKIAGWEQGSLFPGKSLQLIYKYTQGTPRLINILCDRALLVAYGKDRRQVLPRDVKEAQKELKQEEQPRSRVLLTTLLSIAVVCLLLILGVSLYLEPPISMSESVKRISIARNLSPAEPPGESTPVAAAVAVPPVEEVRTDLPPAEINPERIAAMKNAIISMSTDESFRLAARPLASLWGESIVPRGAVNSGLTAMRTLENSGFSTFDLLTDFTELKSMGVPALLEMVIPGVSGKRYFLLTGINENAIRLEPGLTESGWLNRAEFQRLWYGKAVVPYVSPYEISLISRLGEQGEAIFTLQGLLSQVYPQEISPTGVYDQATIDAVTRFQRKHRLVPDGRVGTQTLFWLFKDAGMKMPGLESGSAA